MKLYKNIYRFFDKLEDKVRGRLTHFPIIYALIGSIATVSIWRGIWEVSDNWGIPGWVSAVGGVLLAMITGLFVSFFIGENIIISGLNKEKRTDEKTEEEIQKEESKITTVLNDLKEIKEILKNREIK